MSVILNVEQAALAVSDGGIIAYPTEAVFGLGCDPLNVEAVQAVLNLKRRPQDKGLILIASNWQQLEPFVATLTKEQQQAAQATWPGPVTWVMPANPTCSPILTGGRNTIAVRISAHPIVIALCNACRSALVSTSANTTGEPAITDQSTLIETFNNQISGIVDGELGGLDKPSKIFDVRSGQQLR